MKAVAEALLIALVILSMATCHAVEDYNATQLKIAQLKCERSQ